MFHIRPWCSKPKEPVSIAVHNDATAVRNSATAFKIWAASKATRKQSSLSGMSYIYAAVLPSGLHVRVAWCETSVTVPVRIKSLHIYGKVIYDLVCNATPPSKTKPREALSPRAVLQSMPTLMSLFARWFCLQTASLR